MKTPIFEIDYVDPHSSLKYAVHRFIYLIDPLEDGDLKVGCIYKAERSGKFTMQWEHVPPSDNFRWHQCNSEQECKDYITSNILKWWQQYVPLNIDCEDQEPLETDPDPSLTAVERNPSLL